MGTTSSAVVRKRRVAIGGVALLAFVIAGCLANEVEDNGSCNFGGPSTACIPDATHNRWEYSPNITGGRGSVHQTLDSDSDYVDLWVFKSTVTGSQNLYAKAQHGCAIVFLRECWFEPCDPGILWHEAWQSTGIWYTEVCEGDGKKLIGSFNATADNHFLVGIADWNLAEWETVNYQFYIEAP